MEVEDIPERKWGGKRNAFIGVFGAIERLREPQQIRLQNLTDELSQPQVIHYPGVLLNFRHRRMLGLQPIHLNCRANQRISARR